MFSVMIDRNNYVISHITPLRYAVPLVPLHENSFSLSLQPKFHSNPLNPINHGSICYWRWNNGQWHCTCLGTAWLRSESRGCFRRSIGKSDQHHWQKPGQANSKREHPQGNEGRNA